MELFYNNKSYFGNIVVVSLLQQLVLFVKILFFGKLDFLNQKGDGCCDLIYR
jgi:hypothetical protein